MSEEKSEEKLVGSMDAMKSAIEDRGGMRGARYCFRLLLAAQVDASIDSVVCWRV